MRKRLLLTQACILLLGLASWTYLQAQCPSLFYDGFESGNWSPTWTAGTGSYTRTVVTTAPAQGNYCFMQTGGSGHYNGTYKLMTPATPPTIGWYVKTTSTSTASGYVVIGDANTSSNNGICFAYFNSTGNYRIYSGTLGDFNMPASPNTWYKVELRNINFNTKTYDIWINNTLMQANFPFRSQTTTSIDRVHIYNFTSTTAYWDDMNVGGVSLNLTASQTPALCFGDSTGTASVSTSGGTLPYTYAWSNGGNTQTITALPAGTYAVSVTDSLGCQGSATTTVDEPTAIATADTAHDALCFGDSTGYIDLGTTGGTPGYTYLWSDGQTTASAANLPAGTYMVTVTDANGCIAVDSATVAEPSDLVLAPIVVAPSCFGLMDGSITMQVTGGTPGYFYTWNTGATANGITGIGGGTYTCFVSDGNGCSDGAIMTVTEPGAILSSTTFTEPGCGGDLDGTVDLSVAGGTPSYTYLWSNGATTEDLSAVGAGTYTVTVTDANGCSTIDTVTVTEPPILSHSAVILDDTGPSNGAINLTVGGGNPGYTYLWSNGATTEDLSNLGAGPYTVTVTDAAGCTLVVTFVVNSTVGMAPGQAGPRVQASPNPTGGMVRVAVTLPQAAALELELCDLSGRIVKTVSTPLAATYTEHVLDLGDCSAGVYLLRVRSEGMQSWSRIVRQ